MDPVKRRPVDPPSAPRPAPAALPPALRDAILAWYDATGRRLAFRATRDPYAVLVSELMAQQTQAERAALAWTAWMARFPTVEALAGAPTSDVVRAWAGLGYNRRAVFLQRAAGIIVERHGGRVPSEVAELEALPGVGPYTARAVASIAFGRPVGAVDTNVRRVLGRVAAGGPEAFKPAELQALADASVPPERAGDWTHAVMDVGARLCLPRRPRCADCPALAWCRYAAGERPEFPVDAATAPSSARSRVTVSRRPDPAFPSTTRWLRGRIVARARDAADGSWTRFDQPIGSHGAHAVREAVASLAADGLLDARDTPDGPEARLPE